MTPATTFTATDGLEGILEKPEQKTVTLQLINVARVKPHVR